MKAIFRWIRQTGGLVLRALRLRRSSLGTALRSFLSLNRTDARGNPIVLVWELGGFPGIFKKNAIRLRPCASEGIGRMRFFATALPGPVSRGDSRRTRRSRTGERSAGDVWQR